MSDLIEELKEDLREEKLQAFWKTYGNWIIGGAIAILAGTAITVVWKNWTNKKQQENAQTYEKALELSKTDFSQASALFEQISQRPSGFAMLAEFQLASHALKSSNIEQARNHLKKITEMKHLTSLYRELAIILDLHLAIENPSFPGEEVLKNINNLTKSGPWQLLALELKAIALIRMKDFKAAEDILQELVKMNIPTPAFNHRVRALLALTKSRIQQTEKKADSSS